MDLDAAALAGRVLPIVLTYDSPESLRACLAAIERQTWAPAETLVVDNASTTDTGAVVAAFPRARVHRSPVNTGPAGGYATGLRLFLDSSAEWAWVLDDDCQPEPTCLEMLARHLDGNDGRGRPPVLIPRSIDLKSSTPLVGLAWWGTLIPRRAVEECGVPIEELFYWAEDGEYFLRLDGSGYRLERITDATVVVNHSRSDGEDRPAWKYYYMARNTTWARLAAARNVHRRRDPRHVAHQVRKGARSVVGLAARAVVRERHGRTRKFWAVTRGVADGLRGRLGRTWIPEDGHRPRASSTAHDGPSGQM